MKPHRIFIAINLPEGVKTELLAYREEWSKVPARWTTRENLHLTLAFLGNMSDQELAEISRSMQEVGKRHGGFPLNIMRVVYGPKSNQPRMIWALIDKSKELLTLQKDVERTIERHDSKPFSPHLTLARLKTFQFQGMEPEEIPGVNEEISLSFQVTSIEVMESELRRSGAQYTVCQSIFLQR